MSIILAEKTSPSPKMKSWGDIYLNSIMKRQIENWFTMTWKHSLSTLNSPLGCLHIDNIFHVIFTVNLMNYFARTLYLKVVLTNSLLLKNFFKFFLAFKVIFRISNILTFFKKQKYIKYAHILIVSSKAKMYLSHK